MNSFDEKLLQTSSRKFPHDDHEGGTIKKINSHFQFLNVSYFPRFIEG